MFRGSFILTAFSIGALACSSHDSPSPSASTPSSTASTASLAPQKPTIEKVMSIETGARAGDEWAPALDELEKHLGEPTNIDDDKYGWGVLDGTSCAYVNIVRKGDEVFAFSAPKRVEKGSGWEYAECTRTAGLPAGPPEDPKAVAPPKNGSPVPVVTFIDNVLIGRSKWDKQKVTLVGQGDGISTTGSPDRPDDYSVTILMTAGSSSSMGALPRVHCVLAKGADPPKAEIVSGRLVAKGTVEITEMVTAEGDRIFDARLVDCRVEPQSLSL